jgi:hypothetical protein
MRNSYDNFVGKLEGKRPLGRPRRTWEDNINIALREIMLGNVNWINLAQDRYQWPDVADTMLSLQVR